MWMEGNNKKLLPYSKYRWQQFNANNIKGFGCISRSCIFLILFLPLNLERLPIYQTSTLHCSKTYYELIIGIKHGFVQIGYGLCYIGKTLFTICMPIAHAYTYLQIHVVDYLFFCLMPIKKTFCHALFSSIKIFSIYLNNNALQQRFHPL